MPQIYEVPITISEPAFKIRTILEGVQVVLRFDWVERLSRWTIGIFDNSENPLIVGLTMNIDTELIDRFEINGLPPGRLMFYDTSGGEQEAGFDDLGNRCKIFYENSV